MSTHPLIQRILGDKQVDGEFHRGGPVPRLNRYSEVEMALSVVTDAQWKRVLQQLMGLLPALEDDDSRIVRLVATLAGQPETDEDFFEFLGHLAGATEEMLTFAELVNTLEGLNPENVRGFSPVRFVGPPDEMGRRLSFELIAMALSSAVTSETSPEELARNLDEQMLRIEYSGMRETFVENGPTGDAIVEVLWRGDRHQVRPTHWIVRRRSGVCELLAPTDDGWHLIEGTVEELVQCLPEPLFAHAVSRLLQKEKM